MLGTYLVLETVGKDKARVLVPGVYILQTQNKQIQ